MPETSEKLDIFPLEMDHYRTPPCSRPSSQNGFGLPRTQYVKVTRTRSLSMGADDHKNFNSSHHSAAILYRDSSGDPVVQPLASFECPGGMEDDIISFFKCYKCYDLIPTSAKLVVLDTQLLVKRAFFAMVDTGVRACPLWDSARQQFVGMLTITDFIRILQKNYKGPDAEMEAFEDQRLCEWKGITEQAELFHMYPESSLYDAAALLMKNRIHRLPIINPRNGNVLYVMTQKPLLRFLYKCFPALAKVPLLSMSIGEAGVGTFQNIQVATKDTKVIEALDRFVQDRISALPIVDSEGKLVHIYSKFDVINLAAERTYSNLEVTLVEAISFKNEWFDGVHKCTADETVLAVIERLVKADVARLVMVDKEDRVVGIVTVSDIIRYLVLDMKPPNSALTSTRSSFARKEDSIGEELENLCVSDPHNSSLNVGSASPPRWFTV